MTINQKKPSVVLWYIHSGFLLIILLSWLDELIALPYLLWGGPSPHGNWRESVIETVIALSVWAIVFTYTRRVINRVYYLEGFLTVCAWCRKIHHDDQWIPIEEYVQRGFHAKTSHGMCPTCAKAFPDKKIISPT
jgi:hypothetical protein